MKHEVSRAKVEPACPFVDSYLSDYSESFSSLWDELINWKEREEAEDGRIVNILTENNCKQILDVATGTGFHSLNLMRETFDVVSIDGSQNMLNIAERNANSMGFKLKTEQHDWRSIPDKYHNSYDAVICLGNSFTHLESDADRLTALRNFYLTLKPDGLLLLDQRNYEKMLSAELTESATGNVYCGKSFEIKPSILDERTATFEYSYKNSAKFVLHMHTLYIEQVSGLILNAGFKNNSVEPLHVKSGRSNVNKIDFILHIARK